jgi:Sigma-54 interaction domain
VRAEGISGFAGQPLIHRGQVLGVLAVFARGAIGPECMGWLRMIADHAAAAIATARAFERIEELKAKLELENEYLREEVTGAFGELVGQGPALEALARQIDLVAPTDAAVLVLGESGTGKELVARELHRRSTRAARPLVKVNCAAVPRELYESEFFGHARGAFTGALRDRAGRQDELLQVLPDRQVVLTVRTSGDPRLVLLQFEQVRPGRVVAGLGQHDEVVPRGSLPLARLQRKPVAPLRRHLDPVVERRRPGLRDLCERMPHLRFAEYWFQVVGLLGQHEVADPAVNGDGPFRGLGDERHEGGLVHGCLPDGFT